MDEDQHTPRGTKHLDDDDEDVSYDEKTGISAEVRVQVTCGDMRGTAVLPAGYKKQQEYVLHSDGKKVPPSQFERDAGKGSCKNWKNSVMVVMPDGSEGRTFRVWMESNGYFPVGTKWDESVVNAARALMGRRKKVTSSTGASHAVKTQPAAKKPKPAPAQAAKKVEKAVRFRREGCGEGSSRKVHIRGAAREPSGRRRRFAIGGEDAEFRLADAQRDEKRRAFVGGVRDSQDERSPMRRGVRQVRRHQGFARVVRAGEGGEQEQFGVSRCSRRFGGCP